MKMKQFVLLLMTAALLMVSGCTNSVGSSGDKLYIANKNSGKLHSAACDSLPQPQNSLYFSSIEDAHSAGYTDHHAECMGSSKDMSEYSFIANKSSGKLHSADCDSLPSEANRAYFETIEEAISAGYTDYHIECMGEMKDMITYNFIANKNSGKLHSADCDSLPSEANRVYFVTVADAFAAGYTDIHRECMGAK